MRIYILLSIAITSLFFTSCHKNYEEPVVSLEGYKIEDGFDLKVIASEPFLDAPVAMDFDQEGRIWVADMPGFMDNLEGSGEEKPSGSIKIMQDLDGDGVTDHTKIFLDSLVMPRALALVYGGLLYVEPPNLWFVEIDKDVPGKRTLVDSTYAPEGNPEYQPNGLVLNIDNWIYSAKSNFRYQLKHGNWIKEPTTNRGQWGITHDNFGRLYFNHNAQQLLGDYVLPNRLIRNKFYVPKYGLNRLLTKDQRVYPLQPTAVNRGYAAGVLDSDSLLVNVTAACGPMIYRGGAFTENYNENAFVCVPEANIIKRNILSFYGDSISAEQAWQGKEFLASTDKGFRPVNLKNGPDGSIYVADMHRGVIQHYAFLSPYLKKKAKNEKLDTLTGFGRILKIQKTGKKSRKVPDFDDLSTNELVELLGSKNGWIRDRAQHFLIYNNRKESIPKLKQLANDDKYPISQIHALYTLEGLDALSFELLSAVASRGSAAVTSHAIILLENFISEENAPLVQKVFEQIFQKNSLEMDIYLASTLGSWSEVDSELFASLMIDLYEKYDENNLIIESLVSGSGENIEELASYFKNNSIFLDKNHLQKQMNQIVERKAKNQPNTIYANNTFKMDNRTKGSKLFREICAACHGMDGGGIEGIAPPFQGSEYLSGPAERVALIVLHGLKGPVHVDGKMYETNQAMPGLMGNSSLTNDDISDVIMYVTNAFSRSSKYISPEKINKLRKEKPVGGGEYTEQDLMEYVKALN